MERQVASISRARHAISSKSSKFHGSERPGFGRGVFFLPRLFSVDRVYTWVLTAPLVGLTIVVLVVQTPWQK